MLCLYSHICGWILLSPFCTHLLIVFVWTWCLGPCAGHSVGLSIGLLCFGLLCHSLVGSAVSRTNEAAAMALSCVVALIFSCSVLLGNWVTVALGDRWVVPGVLQILFEWVEISWKYKLGNVSLLPFWGSGVERRIAGTLKQTSHLLPGGRIPWCVPGISTKTLGTLWGCFSLSVVIVGLGTTKAGTGVVTESQSLQAPLFVVYSLTSLMAHGAVKP